MRAQIEKLEALKDAVLALFERAVSDASMRSVWSGDAKEAYYQLVLVDQLLGGGPLDAARASRVKEQLLAAGSRITQVVSELATIADPEAEALRRELLLGAAAFETEVKRRIDPLLVRPPPMAEPPARVIRRSATEYALPCRVCGKIAMVVRVGKTPYDGNEDRLVVEGVMGTTYMSAEGAPPLFAALAAEDLARAHAAADQILEGGLSGYCPECDATYCRDELELQEEFDDGFYDCTYGTCPNGHRRVIDD